LIDPTTLVAVFLLCEEPIGGYEIPVNAPEHDTKLEGRKNWDAVAFGEKYGLKLAGIDFFVSEAAGPGSVAA
jgi:phosphosulfolactate phosphohydrolase-like enzyme